MRAIASASIGALAMALGACHASKGAPGGSGVTLAESAAILKPDAAPGERAVLRLGEEKSSVQPTQFEVVVNASRSGAELTLTLNAQGETIERERYDANAERFRVLEAADNTFAPPIGLLRYPVKDGSESEWRGKVVYAGISRPAHAKIDVAKDGDDIKAAIKLSIEADPGRREVEQNLEFWIGPGKGVIRRSFGDTSVRYPVGESWPR